MAKSMSKDSQIILNMMRVQDKINKIFDAFEDEEIIKDREQVDLLTLYIIKMFSMRKNFSGKTKKAISFFDDFKGNCVMQSLSFCYPTISGTEIIRIARNMSDELARNELTERYDTCIKESENYSG